jgi:hypothetical protein
MGHWPLRCARHRCERTRSDHPRIFFGKGFGDLPNNLAWLRPFGITSAFTLQHPMKGAAVNFGVDDQTGQLSRWSLARLIRCIGDSRLS